MRNARNAVSTIVEIGLFSALGFVIDTFQGAIKGGLFPSGGSIGFAMVAVLIIGFRRGFIPALFTGLIMGLFDFLTGPWIVHPFQPFLDYIFPYALVSLGVLFKPLFDKGSKNQKILWVIIGTVVGGIAKFFSHYASGVIFFGDPATFAWNLNYMSKYDFAFVYNIAYVGPSVVLSAAIMALTVKLAPSIYQPKVFVEEEKAIVSHNSPIDFVTMGIAEATGLFLFIYYLIKYLNGIESYGASGFDADSDCMLIFILGIIMVAFTTFLLIRSIKNKFYLDQLVLFMANISTISLIYGIARLIKSYVKGKTPDLYWSWFGISLAFVAVFAITFAYLVINYKKNKRKLFQPIYRF